MPDNERSTELYAETFNKMGPAEQKHWLEEDFVKNISKFPEDQKNFFISAFIKFNSNNTITDNEKLLNNILILLQNCSAALQIDLINLTKEKLNGKLEYVTKIIDVIPKEELKPEIVQALKTAGDSGAYFHSFEDEDPVDKIVAKLGKDATSVLSKEEIAFHMLSNKNSPLSLSTDNTTGILQAINDLNLQFNKIMIPAQWLQNADIIKKLSLPQYSTLLVNSCANISIAIAESLVQANPKNEKLVGALYAQHPSCLQHADLEVIESIFQEKSKNEVERHKFIQDVASFQNTELINFLDMKPELIDEVYNANKDNMLDAIEKAKEPTEFLDKVVKNTQNLDIIATAVKQNPEIKINLTKEPPLFTKDLGKKIWDFDLKDSGVNKNYSADYHLKQAAIKTLITKDPAILDRELKNTRSQKSSKEMDALVHATLVQVLTNQQAANKNPSHEHKDLISRLVTQYIKLNKAYADANDNNQKKKEIIEAKISIIETSIKKLVAPNPQQHNIDPDVLAKAKKNRNLISGILNLKTKTEKLLEEVTKLQESPTKIKP